jgi:hypothetical protein
VHLATTASLLAVLAGCSAGARQPPVQALSRAHSAPPRVAPPAPSHIGFASASATGSAFPDPPRDCIRTGCGNEAVATIISVPGHHAKGTVTLREVDGGLEVTTSIDGLAGKHLYGVRDGCNATAELLALGDLIDAGNVTAVHSTFLEGAALHALVGHAVVLYWQPDNPYLKHRAPTRIACGVISIPR